MNSKNVRVLPLLLALLLVLLTAVPAAAQPPAPLVDLGGAAWPASRAELQQVAADTWQSFVAMTFENGLPADNISSEGSLARYTSPTNIGAYVWSAIAARDLGIIQPHEARERIATTLSTLATLPRHEPSGQYWNWYDPATGAVLHTWPENGSPVYPFLSTVDNGWLATALIMVTNAVPQLADEAQAILDGMDFGFYHDPQANLLRGGYWTELPPGGGHVSTVSGVGCEFTSETGEGWTCHHYGALNTEPRISSYIGIAWGQVPATHYYEMWRTFPSTCDWGWHEMQPTGFTRTYLGVEVFEGSYTYRDMRIVPSWGGSMFEALMPNLFVPEADWGPQSWGVNHPLYVDAQIEHGLQDAQYGFWGFSPASKPEGGYREYGVDAIGMEPNGYASNNDNTWVDYGFGECRPAQPIPGPEAYTNGVVTPHAAFLALEFARAESLANLARLAASYQIYGWGGFYDSVNVDTGEVAKRYLALDQGMIMAAIANDEPAEKFRNYFAREIQDEIEPLLAAEEFSAGQGGEASMPASLGLAVLEYR